MTEALNKRCREMLGSPEDRTSQEEAVARAKLGLAPRQKAPPGHALLDKHLVGAVQFLAMRGLCAKATELGQTPDPDTDRPSVLRDKRAFVRAQGDFGVLAVLIKDQHSVALHAHAMRKLSGAPERVRRIHERTLSAKYCKSTEIIHYVKPSGAPPARDLITGKQVAGEDACVMLQFDADEPVYVSRQVHMHLLALHVAHHFWDYVWAAIEEQCVRGGEPDSETVGKFTERWQRWVGNPPAGEGAFWKYMGATPFRQRLIQLRACLLSTMEEAQ